MNPVPQTTSDETLLERYARAPQSLSVGQRRAAEALLGQSATARETLWFYQAFYDELEATPATLPPALTALLDHLFPSLSAPAC